MTALPAFRPGPDGGKLFVAVAPGASRNQVEGFVTGADGQERLKIRVTAPPDKGAANEAVLRLLSKCLKLPKAALSLKSGATGRAKTIEISGAAEEISARLASLTGGGQ